MVIKTARRKNLFTLCVVSAFIAGCSSGSGDGLDENGLPIAGEEAPDADIVDTPDTDIPVVAEPIDEAPEPVVSAFAEIQTTIFTPICSECHGPVAPSAGLQLNADASFAAIVGVASTEVPSLMRIEPNDPDNSYLIQKLEGTQAVGAQMPLGGPPLAQDTIDFVRQWISDGAPPATPDAAAFAPRVVSATIEENAVYSTMPSTISIVWSTPVEAASFDDNTVFLLGSGGDGTFNDGNEIAIDVAMAEMNNPYVARLIPAIEKLDDTFQLNIVGNGDIYARAIDGGPIDGDSDGVQGGDFIRRFTISNP